MAHILIVDDEPDVRGLVRLILELAGHEVVEAHHGAAALERLRDGHFDLLVTDVMMPVMGGNELIDQVRADPERDDLPIVVLSASPHNIELANHVMRKPFVPAALREVAAKLTGADGGS